MNRHESKPEWYKQMEQGPSARRAFDEERMEAVVEQARARMQGDGSRLDSLDGSRQLDKPESLDQSGQAGQTDRRGSHGRLDRQGGTNPPGIPDQPGQADRQVPQGRPGVFGQLGRFAGVGVGLAAIAGMLIWAVDMGMGARQSPPGTIGGGIATSGPSTAPTTAPTPAIPSAEPTSQVSTAPQRDPISEQQAIAAAKRMDPEGDAIWSAKYMQAQEVEPGKAKRDVWAVTAEYPAGNRMIVWLDAATGEQLTLTEIEAPGFAYFPDKGSRPTAEYTLPLDDAFLKAAAAGQVAGIDAVIGIPKQTLLDAWGEPDEIGLEHVEYLRYGPARFYIWEGDRVGVIDVDFKGTAEDIRGKLGVPAFDGASDAGIDEYTLGYETGRYYLYFKYTDKNADHGVLRFKNPHGGF